MNIKEVLSLYDDNISFVVRKFFKNPFDAEEAKQEISIKLWQNLEKKKEGNFKGWLNIVAKNTCLDFLKLKKNKFDYESEDQIINKKDSRQNIEDKLISVDYQKKISKAVYSLNSKYREVIILYEVDGFSYEEISKKINKPIGTVKSRLYSARKILSEILLDSLEKGD